MAQAQNGDKVIINYTGTLEDGSVFDSTLEASECDDENCCEDDCCDDDCNDDDCGCGHASGPIAIVLGEATLFPQIDEAIIGMAPGETKTIVIKAADGFGEYDQERVFTVPRSDLPEDMAPEVGDELVLANEDDEELGVLVLEANADSVTFDANHPLAGEDLTFSIELVQIDSAA